MTHPGGPPQARKRELARILISSGDGRSALRLLGGSCFGAGYDCDYFYLMGRALLLTDSIINAGRFLFLSGVRGPEVSLPIAEFIRRNSDRNNFRQLQSQFPLRVRTYWHLSRFPASVASDLRKLGWPEDTQQEIVRRKRVSALCVGKYAKQTARGARFAQVALRLGGEVRGAPPVVYQLSHHPRHSLPRGWLEGVRRGAQFAFGRGGVRPRSVRVADVLGLNTDTSPAVVGVATTIAIYDALGLDLGDSMLLELDEIAWQIGLDASFPERCETGLQWSEAAQQTD